MSDMNLQDIKDRVRKDAKNLTKAPMLPKAMKATEGFCGAAAGNTNNSYGALMSYDGDEFIRNLYRVLLLREAGENEVENMRGILAGNDKDYLLAVIALSQECKNKKQRVTEVNVSHLDVNMLLQFDDREFVVTAFEWILGRPASAEDTASHTDMIRKGTITKVDMIAALKNSPEGSGRRIVLDNMKRAIKSNKKHKLRNKISFMRKIDELYRKDAAMKTEMGDISDRLAQTRTDLDETTRQKDEILNTLSTINDDIFNSWMTSEDRLHVMNRELSTHPTVWGDPKKLHISSKASVATCLFNTNSGEITVGDYTFAGSNVSILAGSHDMYLDGLVRRDESIDEGCDITIGSSVWLASNAVVLGPCTIGDNSVIAAGAVVTPGTVVPANVIYGGIPAKQIGVLDGPNAQDKRVKALEDAVRRSGVLYKEGWSERKVCENIEGRPVGHFLSTNQATIITDKANVTFEYYLDSKNSFRMMVGQEIYTIEPGHGEIEVKTGANGVTEISIESQGRIGATTLWLKNR